MNILTVFLGNSRKCESISVTLIFTTDIIILMSALKTLTFSYLYVVCNVNNVCHSTLGILEIFS